MGFPHGNSTSENRPENCQTKTSIHSSNDNFCVVKVSKFGIYLMNFHQIHHPMFFATSPETSRFEASTQRTCINIESRVILAPGHLHEFKILQDSLSLYIYRNPQRKLDHVFIVFTSLVDLVRNLLKFRLF